MALYAACDLHSNNTVLAVIDEGGRCVAASAHPVTCHSSMRPWHRSARICTGPLSNPPTTPIG